MSLDLAVEAVKTPLNFELGKKMKANLVKALVSTSGVERTQVERKLDAGVDLVQTLIDEVGKNPDIMRGSKPLYPERFGQMTGEEKALIAHYFLIALQIKNDGSRYKKYEVRESPAYQIYEQNKRRAAGKAEYTLASFFTTIPQVISGHIDHVKVGTTADRMWFLEQITDAVVNGPSDVDPTYTWKVDDYLTTEHGEKIKTGTQFTEFTTFADRSLQNFLYKNVPLGQSATQVAGDLSSLLHQ